MTSLPIGHLMVEYTLTVTVMPQKSARVGAYSIKGAHSMMGIYFTGALIPLL